MSPLSALQLEARGTLPLAILRQTAQAGGTIALTFIGLTVVTFVIGRVVPIDPLLAILGDRAPAAVYDRMRHELGLDLPLLQQYAIYLWKVVQGDFGNSVVSARPVLEDIIRVFPATIELATVATFLGIAIGIPLGVFAAVNQGTWIDHTIRVVGLAGYSVPIFWLGLVGLLVFYAKLGWIGGPGRLDVFYDGIVPFVTGSLIIDSLIAGETKVLANAISHLALPAVLVGYFSVAYISRMTRSFMLDQLQQEYIVTARVKGASEQRVIWLHAFPNVLVPMVTVISLSYASLLEGAVLTETVFAWPGLGLYVTTALFNADLNAVLGATIVIGATYMTINLLSDWLYRLLDPRLR
jgi:peptide/nickel transport system permease protein